MPAPQPVRLHLGPASRAVGSVRRADGHPDLAQLGSQRSRPAQVLPGTIAAHRFHQGGQDRVRIRCKPRRYARRPRRYRGVVPDRSCASWAGRAGGAVLRPLNRPTLSRRSRSRTLERGVDTGLSRPCAGSAATATAAFDRHRKLFDQVVGTDSEVLGGGIGRDRIRLGWLSPSISATTAGSLPSLPGVVNDRRSAAAIPPDFAAPQTDVTDPAEPRRRHWWQLPGAGHPRHVRVPSRRPAFH